MFDYLNLIAAVVFAYLLGAIPTSVWIGRWLFGEDVRKKGSGNAGATNTMRILGPRVGILVLAIDILKGFFAVNLAVLFVPSWFSAGQIVFFEAMLGTIATLGHVFPVYVGFRGGKGVATLVGVLAALHPHSLFVILGVFLVVFVLFQYVSLASIVAALSFPLVVMLIFGVREPGIIAFSCAVAIFVPLTHRKNIRRLLIGEENKFTIRRKEDQGI